MNGEIKQPVCNNIRQRRLAAGWSQQELAEKTDTTRQTINAIELGKYLPSLELAFRIARLFDTDVESIFQDPNRPAPEIFDLLAVIPAKDLSVSLSFYLTLGFKQISRHHGQVEMQLATQRFLLSAHYTAEFAANFQMTLRVPDLEGWWLKLLALDLPSRFSGVMLRAPITGDDKLKTLSFTDPSGVLWHMTELHMDPV